MLLLVGTARGFEAAWRRVRPNIALQGALLESIPIQEVSAVMGGTLTPSLLHDYIRACLHQLTTSSCKRGWARDFLNALATATRYDITYIRSTSPQKQALRQLWEDTASKHPDAGLDDAHKPWDKHNLN